MPLFCGHRPMAIPTLATSGICHESHDRGSCEYCETYYTNEYDMKEKE